LVKLFNLFRGNDSDTKRLSLISLQLDIVKFLIIQEAQEQQLTEIIEIDQLCFGGWWSRSAYQRELTSPNSILLTLALEESAQSNLNSATAIPAKDYLGKTARAERKIEQAEGETSVILEREKGNQIVGIACFWAIVEEAHITLLGIIPEYQRQGLGQLLLYVLLQQAVERKLERATLEVRASNQAAINLYEKFGFRIAGRRKKYYPQTGEDALILWRGGLSQPEFQTDLVNWEEKISNRLATDYIIELQKTESEETNNLPTQSKKELE
jgi:ribosomal-protein-alanine N-acetyltransferase